MSNLRMSDGDTYKDSNNKAWVHKCFAYGSAVWHKRTDNYCPLCGAHWSEHKDVQMPEKLRLPKEC